MIVREENGVKVVLVDRLPPEVLAKVQALYARRPESMETHLDGIYAEMRHDLRAIISPEPPDNAERMSELDKLLDTIMAWADADGASAAKFMDTWYVGYGHASIGDCAVGAVLGVEGISELACKALQHWPLFSGQQTSTRAVDVSKVRIIDPIGTPASKDILDRWMNFYTQCDESVSSKIRRDHPRLEDESEKDYENAVRMRSFDIRRGFLPAGLTTQTSLAMNLRQLSDELTWLQHHPLREVRRISYLIQSVLQERYPASGSFGNSATLSGIGTREVNVEDVLSRDTWLAKTAGQWTYHEERLRPGRRYSMLSFEEQHVFVEFSSTIDTGTLLLNPYKDVLKSRPRGCVLPRVFDDLGTCTATTLLDWGAWRDVERQRAGTCRVPMLTMDYGFEGWYLDNLSCSARDEAIHLLLEQQEDIERLTPDPLLRQYYIPFGCRVPTTLTYTLPIWAYVLELRTGPNVHPTLRKAMLRCADAFETQFGTNVPLHLDRRSDVWSIRRGKQVINKKESL